MNVDIDINIDIDIDNNINIDIDSNINIDSNQQETRPPDGNLYFVREIDIALKKWQQEGYLRPSPFKKKLIFFVL